MVVSSIVVETTMEEISMNKKEKVILGIMAIASLLLSLISLIKNFIY